MKDKMKLSVNNREGTLIITIAVIFVAMCILKGELFYARSNIEAIFSNLAYDLLLACGMTFVIILGGVDLSVGAVLALSGIICTLMIQKGINIVLAVGLGILFGGAIGAVNGILVSKANVAPFVATLGSQSICRGACYVLTSGYFVAGLTDAYTNIGRGSLLGVPIRYWYQSPLCFCWPFYQDVSDPCAACFTWEATGRRHLFQVFRLDLRLSWAT